MKLSHQGEIKLVSDWGTTFLPKEQRKVINFTKFQARKKLRSAIKEQLFSYKSTQIDTNKLKLLT